MQNDGSQSAEVLWLALRVERNLGDRNAEASLGFQLRKNYPEFARSASPCCGTVRVSEAPYDFAVEAAPVQPGPQLAAAREACGFSVVDVARQLKLSPWQIEALEADDYSRLPGTVFVRGFIRNYARLVKLDPARLLALAESDSPSPAARPVPELPPSAEIPFPGGYRFPWQKYAIAALVLLVPIVVFEFYRDDTTEVAVKSRPLVLPPAPVVVASERAGAAGTAGSDHAGRRGNARRNRRNENREKTRSNRRRLPRASAVIEHKPGEHLVKLRFERESWVEIRDRSGHKIFSQLNPAGTEQAVSGQPPLTLVVGNAAGVQLIHNDQPVDLAPHIKVDVARLTLE